LFKFDPKFQLYVRARPGSSDRFDRIVSYFLLFLIADVSGLISIVIPRDYRIVQNGPAKSFYIDYILLL